MNGTETGRERTVAVEERAAGLSVSQIMLVAVLLAAGAVMEFFIGSELHHRHVLPRDSSGKAAL